MGVFPSIGLCPVCSKEFEYKIRVQGGGRRPKYCSARCRSLDWVHGNGGKRKATVVKYDTNPVNKEKKKRASFLRLLKKYHWTEEAFKKQLLRQHGKCAGCLLDFDGSLPCIDHCHVTGNVRGILCHHCNWGLGHLKDNPETMRRLMAYLERDINKTLVYLIGALKNERVPEIGNELRKEGYDVMDEWFTPGKEADENWQKYEAKRGRSFTEALRGRAATNIFLFDRSYLDLADIVILVMPAGKSAMLELGYAKGRGKKTVLFLDGADPDRYDIMPNFADEVISDKDLLIERLKELNGQHNEDLPF